VFNRKVIVNEVLGYIFKETVAAYFKVLSQHFPLGTATESQI
jgi:hypothetical protein